MGGGFAGLRSFIHAASDCPMRSFPFLLLFVLVVTLAGCGDGRPKRLAVSGQVLIDGKPLTYGHIRFVPKGARPSGGRLDDQGRFTLSCYGENDGIVPGVHRVEVNASEPLTAKTVKWHAPKKYFRYTFSGLEQEITDSTDSLVINLTWDGGKPFVERIR
jgi:hypothetical protein